MSSKLGSFFEVQSSPISSEGITTPTAPSRAFPKDYHAIPLPRSQDDIELENIQWGGRSSRPVSGTQTPRTPNDLEMSRPASPTLDEVDGVDGVDAMQSFSSPPINRFRMFAVSLLNFSNGLSDAAPGALIPYIEEHYNIGYAIVSLVFVTNAVGFILAAFFVDALRTKYGRAKTIIFAQVLLVSGYIAIVCTPPFPVVVVAFFFMGWGMATTLALSNVFAANLQDSTKMLGMLHGAYGIGGTIGPIIATAMVTQGALIWSRYYLLTLSMAVFNLVFAAWSFWHYEKEFAAPSLLTALERSASQQNAPSRDSATAKPSNQFTDMMHALKSKTVVLGSVFIFAYQGSEVSISGWVISFLIANRNGNPSAVGYVTAGFWGGITLGRFLLSPLAYRVGEKIFVYGMIIGAAVFELLVWQVPNIIGDALAVSIVGLLLGPIYPCATVIFSRAIGRKHQVSSLGVISAFGSSGGAVAPFTTGILAQAAGTFVLHPIAIGLFGVMVACWYGLPNVRKRTE